MLDSSKASAPRASDLFTGAAMPVRALWLTFTRPKVLALSLLCGAVTGVVLIALAYLLWGPASSLARGWVGERSGLAGALGTGLAVVLYLVMLAASWLTVPPALLAPLQDPLSEATEEALGDFSPPAFSLPRALSGVLLALSHTVLRLLLQLLGYALLLPLNFIPGAGSVLWAVLSSVWTMWWIAAEYLSGPMARHLYPFRQVLAAMRARPAMALGFGATLHVLLIVPIVNFFLVPLAVVGATLYFRELKARGALRPT